MPYTYSAVGDSIWDDEEQQQRPEDDNDHEIAQAGLKAGSGLFASLVQQQAAREAADREERINAELYAKRQLAEAQRRQQEVLSGSADTSRTAFRRFLDALLATQRR